MALIKFQDPQAFLAKRVFNNSLKSNIVDSFFQNNWINNDIAAFVPAVNVSEDKENFYIDLAAPGLSKEAFEINAENDQLIISANVVHQQKELKYSRKEFSAGSFKRTFSLPEEVNSDEISAKYLNGILQITLPKKDEAKFKSKRIIDII
jgi:HSP20 family protein